MQLGKVAEYKRKKELLALGVPQEVIDKGFDDADLYLKLKEFNLEPTIWVGYYSKESGVSAPTMRVIKSVRAGKTSWMHGDEKGSFPTYVLDLDDYTQVTVNQETLTGDTDKWGVETIGSFNKKVVEDWCDEKMAEHFVNVTNKSNFDLKVNIRISKDEVGVIRFTLEEILEALNNKEASLDEKHLIIRKKDGAVMGEFLGYELYEKLIMV